MTPSGTESLNFTRDTQRCCQPWQLTPGSPADSPSVHAGNHQLRMLRCSQVTVPHAQEETEVTHPPVPARGKQKPKYKSVSFQQDHYHTHNRPFKPPHLYAVLAFNLMCQRTQNILQFSSRQLIPMLLKMQWFHPCLMGWNKAKPVLTLPFLLPSLPLQHKDPSAHGQKTITLLKKSAL